RAAGEEVAIPITGSRRGRRRLRPLFFDRSSAVAARPLARREIRVAPVQCALLGCAYRGPVRDGAQGAARGQRPQAAEQPEPERRQRTWWSERAHAWTSWGRAARGAGGALLRGG